MKPSVLFLALSLALASGLASAAAAAPTIAEGVKFWHKDWELACDNTGICRAAGYHEDRADLPVSVLVTRRPGPATRP